MLSSRAFHKTFTFATPSGFFGFFTNLSPLLANGLQSKSDVKITAGYDIFANKITYEIMINFLIFLGAAIAEIAGCFTFWAWMRLEKSVYWLIPGMLSLSLFAYLLTMVESSYAGRAYAAYGAIYICSSLAWMWIIENNPPTRADILGAAVCLIGAGIILFAQKL